MQLAKDSESAEFTHNVNQHVQWITGPLLHKLGGIMFVPLRLRILPKVASESLLSPRTFAWIGNGSEGGNTSILAGILKELWLLSVCELD